MSPTAAMLILSHHYKSSPTSPTSAGDETAAAFQVSVSAGKWFSSLFLRGPVQQQQKHSQTSPPPSSASLEQRFQEALQLSCWSS
uniref:Uncharacterized protein n=1 Tax=Nelumbo nucifera TaxID=4432 RepID=A0A822Z6V7_NELNU|nr:TPA_asm: hypothetical protein HUJ06_014683 [Nelumbo nucifera]